MKAHQNFVYSWDQIKKFQWGPYILLNCYVSPVYYCCKEIFMFYKTTKLVMKVDSKKMRASTDNEAYYKYAQCQKWQNKYNTIF